MDDLIAQNFAKLMQANEANGQMAIRRVTADVASGDALQLGKAGARDRNRRVTAGPEIMDKKPWFGVQRTRKKTLVDIELDADSDLEDFDNNQMMKIRGAVREEEEGEDDESELKREPTQIDNKPGSLQSESEFVRQTMDEDEFQPDAQREDDTMVAKVAAPSGDTVSVDQNSEMPGVAKKNANMCQSIFIQDEPITHEYADVEQPKQSAKAKNYKRTFVDQSNFSYFNTLMDEDLAQKKL
jgi:hypothetical protein